MIDILKEGLLGSVKSVYSIAIMVIPLMVLLQLAKDYNVINKIGRYFHFVTKVFKISEASIFPLLVGFIFGISYGAGVIIQSAKEDNLSKRDMLLISVFLVVCHAIVEDTLLLVIAGANGSILIGTRFILAIIVTYFVSKKVDLKDVEDLDCCCMKKTK